jgi:hypothetical protein
MSRMDPSVLYVVPVTSNSDRWPVSEVTHATRVTLIWLVVKVPVLSLHTRSQQQQQQHVMAMPD